MTNNKQQYIQTLPIATLLNSDQYIIPIYQRNYAWGNDEIVTPAVNSVQLNLGDFSYAA